MAPEISFKAISSMSVLDCLYLVVSRPCSSLLSFPWTFLHGWERSFLCPSFSKPSLTSWDLPSSWHGLCAPSPPLSCLLSLCVPDRKWDKTPSTERLFFWGFFGGCFYCLWENRDVPMWACPQIFHPSNQTWAFGTAVCRRPYPGVQRAPPSL